MDAEPRTVTTRTGPVCVLDEGSGPPLVAIHGLPGSKYDFRWIAPLLRDSFRVVRIDQPGFGGTPLSTMPHASLLWRVDHLAAVLDALELSEVTLLAHSMGGPLATHFAVRYPERVRAVALVASVGARPHRALRSLPLPMLLSALLRLWPTRALLGPKVVREMRKTFPNLDEPTARQSLHLVAATSLQGHGECMSRMRCETLVAWSEDDPLVDRDISEELYWRAPSGPRICFPDGGHHLFKTRPKELAEALRAWRSTGV